MSVALSGAALSPGGASAAARFHTSLPVGGPALAAGSPVWAEGRRDGRVVVRRRDPATGEVRTILAGPDNGQSQFARIAGSQSALGVEILSGGYGACADNPFCVRDVFAGPPAGPLSAQQASCSLNGVTELPEGIDVGGPRVAFPTCSSTHASIFDEATNETRQAPAGFRGLRIAGRYLAWVTGDPFARDNGIRVYDWRSRKLVYVLSKSQTHGFVSSLDLAPDGRVAWAISTGNPGNRIAWASPQSMHPHVIPVPERDYYSVRIVGRAIAFERGTVAIEIPRADVGITDLSGHAKILAKGAAMDAFEPQFDFDGKRIAWYAYACTGARMHVQSLDSSKIRESLIRCPLRFKRHSRVRGGSTVDLAVDCYGYAQGCKGVDATLRRSRAPHSVVGRGKNAHHIKLTAEGVRLLQTHKRLRLKAAITLTDLAGTRERRVGSVTVSRP